MTVTNKGLVEGKKDQKGLTVMEGLATCTGGYLLRREKEGVFATRLT